MDREHQKGTVATIGAFDGVHVGHVKILEKVSERAEKMGLGAAVFTFDPHPDEVLGKLKEKRFLLTTPREKHALLSNLGIEIEVVLEFTAAMGRLGASQFVKKYLLKPLCLKELVIGHDFRLGRGRKGSAPRSRFGIRLHRYRSRSSHLGRASCQQYESETGRLSR
jgi:riboflavin kinase/FMN adenylyltransferase